MVRIQSSCSNSLIRFRVTLLPLLQYPLLGPFLELVNRVFSSQKVRECIPGVCSSPSPTPLSKLQSGSDSSYPPVFITVNSVSHGGWVSQAEHSLLNWWLEDLAQIVYIYLKFNPFYAKCQLFADIFGLKNKKIWTLLQNMHACMHVCMCACMCT